MAVTKGLTSARRGCGADMRGPHVSGARMAGLPWTGTTRVIHRRSTGSTARIGPEPIGRCGGGQARLGSAQSRPTGHGDGARTRTRVADDGNRRRRRQRKAAPKGGEAKATTNGRRR
ncbi:hypothetical protein [Oryza sativa Japonica Group]|uniref:Uncharacterized protein n=1 Tax=Oryza sativa subsp. japonica TaxID=39947 RepID=Q5SN05_ORYSJ|nr:hypothetical protein [Oryza sativa Japonica Group]BAD72399.1 hypothetical protein [Oryza sativa Japonica Group]